MIEQVSDERHRALMAIPVTDENASVTGFFPWQLDDASISAGYSDVEAAAVERDILNPVNSEN